jgi:iduronate 2-sulfatase
MMNRYSVRTTFLFALLFNSFLFTSWNSEVVAADRPNVLFLICDDLNCDLGVYGHPQVKSPNIDRLAKQGLRFDNAHCQFSLCGPSRASFMTGLYPDQTLVRRNAVYIREHVPNVITMSQMFRKNDYMAIRVGKIYHYSVPLHIGTGGHDDPYSWDYTINPIGRDVHDQDQVFSVTPGRYGGSLSWLAAEGTDEEQTDGIAASEAIQILNRHAENQKPFFLAVGLYRPHTPYVAPKKYFDMYPTESIKIPVVSKEYLKTIPLGAQKTVTAKRANINLEEKIARQAIQAYYASITFADAQLGRILDALKSSGLDKNTIIVFTSDHGYHMGEHGHYQKMTLFNNGTNVPLIIAGPGVKSVGKISNAPVEMIDFYPTLADLCGMKKPKHLSGVSLKPVLDDPSARPREAALTHYRRGASPNPNLVGYSIKTERFRYTAWGKGGAGGVEFYDHKNDPEEMVNLAGNQSYQKHQQKMANLWAKRVAKARQAPPGIRQINFQQNRRVPK